MGIPIMKKYQRDICTVAINQKKKKKETFQKTRRIAEYAKNIKIYNIKLECQWFWNYLEATVGDDLTQKLLIEIDLKVT